MKKKYRLIKKTKLNGYTNYIIEKREWVVFWWLWQYVDSFGDEAQALALLERLRNGEPPEVRQVIA